MEACPIGLVGWGTVGSGVVEILERDRSIFRDRCGLDIQIAAIVTRTPGRKRGQSSGPALVSDRLEAVLANPHIKVVVHLVGGVTEAADICKACLKAGKHVVTANKAMLATHGDSLFPLAARHGVSIAFEAAVAGGVPIIAALRSGLVANRIEGIYGILNGTCNHILTRMEEDGLSYRTALGEAQQLGYAEADPSLDVDGRDTAHKLALLARIAFHGRIPLPAIKCTGIDSISVDDILSARTLGCRIKLLAVARLLSGGLELRVAPTLVPLAHPLASVRSNFNGIFTLSSNAGPTLLTGQGAGALPTASAVLSDVVDLCTGSYQATSSRFRFFSTSDEVAILPEADEVSGCYARFLVPDRAGVLAGITNVLCSSDISILSIHQGVPNHQGLATIELLTHPVRRGDFLAAVSQIDSGGLTVKPTVILRRL